MSTHKTGLRKPKLSIHWESRFFQSLQVLLAHLWVDFWAFFYIFNTHFFLGLFLHSVHIRFWFVHLYNPTCSWAGWVCVICRLSGFHSLQRLNYERIWSGRQFLTSFQRLTVTKTSYFRSFPFQALHTTWIYSGQKNGRTDNSTSLPQTKLCGEFGQLLKYCVKMFYLKYLCSQIFNPSALMLRTVDEILLRSIIKIVVLLWEFKSLWVIEHQSLYF